MVYIELELLVVVLILAWCISAGKQKRGKTVIITMRYSVQFFSNLSTRDVVHFLIVV